MRNQLITIQTIYSKIIKAIPFLIFIQILSCTKEYHTETIIFYNEKTKLKGTLYKPKSIGPYPVILLAHGSGKGDRNSFYYKPYGSYFSQNGIAVFIYDKRGVGDSEGSYDESPDFNLLASDLKAAFQELKKRPDIDKSKAGILGISQAAWVVPIAIQQLDSLAFVVCTSCPLVPPYQSDLFQKGRELAEKGYSKTDIEDIIYYNQSVTEYVATLSGRDPVIQLKQKFKDRPWFKSFKYSPDLSPEDTLKTPPYDHYRKSVFQPMPYWKTAKAPILFVYGEKDSHIPVDQSLQILKDSLTVSIQTFKNSGHLIQPVKEPVEPLTFNLMMFIRGRPQPSQEYLDYVKNWIMQQKI